MPPHLAKLFDWITHPDPNARPQSAEALLARLSGAPDQTRAPWRKRAAIAALFALTLGGLAYWLSRPPVLLDNYHITASRDAAGTASLLGHVPTATDRDALATRFTALTGGTADLSLARGAPSQDWPRHAIAIMEALALDHWEYTLKDTTIAVSGHAASTIVRDSVAAHVADLAQSWGYAANIAITAGILNLDKNRLTETLNAVSACGPVQVDGPNILSLSDPIVARAPVAMPQDVERLVDAIKDLAGDREVIIQPLRENPHICAFRAAVPKISAEIAVIVEGGGGSFDVGDNPIIDVHFQGVGSGALWVLYQNPDGSLIHLLPNTKTPYADVADLAAENQGSRVVRVLGNSARNDAPLTGAYLRLVAADRGRAAVIVIKSQTPMFGTLRPGANTQSFIAALKEEAANQPLEIAIKSFYIN